MESYRFNNLVYIPITKHASSSYTELFKNVLNWKTIQSDKIDWLNDKVFAHIINPYERHLKGIAECLKKYEIDSITEDPRFLKLLTTAVFDLHSYPLAITFGDKLHSIDWLLLDHHRLSGDYITHKFLKSYGVMVQPSDIPKINTSGYRVKALTNKVRQLREDNDLTGTLTYFYERDVVLYDLVNQYTNLAEIENYHWDQISWLNNAP